MRNRVKTKPIWQPIIWSMVIIMWVFFILGILGKIDLLKWPIIGSAVIGAAAGGFSYVLFNIVAYPLKKRLKQKTRQQANQGRKTSR